jgi:hypothetical protein
LKLFPRIIIFQALKKDFSIEFENIFSYLVDVTEPICQEIDSELASTLAFDTPGIEAYVIENSPKFINFIIRKLKQYYKDKPDVDIYKMAYGLMLSNSGRIKIGITKHYHISATVCMTQGTFGFIHGFSLRKTLL